MITQSTIDKLIEMRLTAMSDAFIIQKDDPKMKEVSFEDRFGMLVDIEYSNRKSNSLKRLIHNAGFDQSDASIVDINYTSGRKLNRELINRLATCEYITEHRNLFITGATGSGKTYMACAFGMEACKQRYKTKYVRLPDLLLELEMARNDGTYKKVQAKYANPVLLIIDEWLLLKPTESEQHDILELLHRRRKKSSTIFCSQYEPSGWYDQLGGDDSPLAEAILDRIKHDASLRNLMLNVISDKVEHCKLFGIEIKEEQWPSHQLPLKLVTDQGSEYKGETFGQIIDLGVELLNLQSFRADEKGPVEQCFNAIQNYFKPILKGKGVIEVDFQERGSHDYRKDACLTMEQFEKVILNCIIFYNSNRVLERFPFTEDMLEAEVKPIPCHVWKWACEQLGANLTGQKECGGIF